VHSSDRNPCNVSLSSSTRSPSSTKVNNATTVRQRKPNSSSSTWASSVLNRLQHRISSHHSHHPLKERLVQDGKVVSRGRRKSLQRLGRLVRLMLSSRKTFRRTIVNTRSRASTSKSFGLPVVLSSRKIRELDPVVTAPPRGGGRACSCYALFTFTVDQNHPTPSPTVNRSNYVFKEAFGVSRQIHL
jgi:hypothetical protein